LPGAPKGCGRMAFCCVSECRPWTQRKRDSPPYPAAAVVFL